jgi:hypothetical protein
MIREQLAIATVAFAISFVVPRQILSDIPRPPNSVSRDD